MVEDLNLGQPRTNPSSGQSRTQTRDRQIASPTSWPLGHTYMGRKTLEKSDMLVSSRKTFSRSFLSFSQTFLSLFSSAGSVWEALVSAARSEKRRTASGIQVHSTRGQKNCNEILVFFFFHFKTQINQKHTFAFIRNKNNRHTSRFINHLVYILFSSKNQTFAGRNCANAQLTGAQTNFKICGQNPAILLFKWNVFGRRFA